MSARSTQSRHLPSPLTSTKRSKAPPPPSQICTHTRIGGPNTWSGVFVQLVWGGHPQGGRGVAILPFIPAHNIPVTTCP